MAEKLAYLSISRGRSISNALRGFSVLVDDSAIDKIKAGETKKYALPAGPRVICIAVDYFKSEPVTVDLEEGATVELECGDLGPDTLGETLSIKGIGGALKALVSPSGYLYLNVLRAPPPKTRAQRPSVAHPKKAGTTRLPGRRCDQNIFLSYRREDSRAITGRISDRLIDHFGKPAIFRDVDSIPVGVDFRTRIKETIDQTDILIAVIGPDWLDVRDDEDQRRLCLAEDYVRLEIESALSKDIPVVPVLVDAANMPPADKLPDSLAPLAYRNALFIPREPYFHAGLDKLIDEIEGLGRAQDDAGSQSKFCTGCGSVLAGSKFCTNCGQPLSH